MKKPDYGKVPAYLEKVKEEVKREYEHMEQQMQASEFAPHDGLRMLSEYERLEILNGLKAKWAALNKQYQTMSFTIDTINKRVRYADRSFS